MEPDDVMLVTSPASWITGIAYTIIPILLGATRVIMTYTNETDLLQTMQNYKVQYAGFVDKRCGAKVNHRGPSR